MMVVTLRPSGTWDDDLLGAHGLAGAERLGQGEFFERDLAPVGAAESKHVEELLWGAVRHTQVSDNPFGFLVERDDAPRPGVEGDDADGRGIDQCFQVGPGALLLAVSAGVGDDQGRLRCEHDQDFFCLRR